MAACSAICSEIETPYASAELINRLICLIYIYYGALHIAHIGYSCPPTRSISFWWTHENLYRFFSFLCILIETNRISEWTEKRKKWSLIVTHYFFSTLLSSTRLVLQEVEFFFTLVSGLFSIALCVLYFRKKNYFSSLARKSNELKLFSCFVSRGMDMNSIQAMLHENNYLQTYAAYVFDYYFLHIWNSSEPLSLFPPHQANNALEWSNKKRGTILIAIQILIPCSPWKQHSDECAEIFFLDFSFSWKMLISLWLSIFKCFRRCCRLQLQFCYICDTLPIPPDK